MAAGAVAVDRRAAGRPLAPGRAAEIALAAKAAQEVDQPPPPLPMGPPESLIQVLNVQRETMQQALDLRSRLGALHEGLVGTSQPVCQLQGEGEGAVLPRVAVNVVEMVVLLRDCRDIVIAIDGVLFGEAMDKAPE